METKPTIAGRLKQAGIALMALLIGAALWMPCLHWFYVPGARDFRSPTDVSPVARELAARHLKLWTDPVLRHAELDKMRRSNAEWDFMGRSFLVWALANMALRDPAYVQDGLKVMDQIIDETLKMEKEDGMYVFLMPYAKFQPYTVDPPRSMFIDGEIAMMLAARRLVQEKPEYQTLLQERVNLIVSRMEASPLLSGESYPDEYWVFDNVTALAALRMADRLDGTDHSGLCARWIDHAKKNFVDPENGLLVPRFDHEGVPLDPPPRLHPVVRRPLPSTRGPGFRARPIRPLQARILPRGLRLWLLDRVSRVLHWPAGH